MKIVFNFSQVFVRLCQDFDTAYHIALVMVACRYISKYHENVTKQHVNAMIEKHAFLLDVTRRYIFNNVWPARLTNWIVATHPYLNSGL